MTHHQPPLPITVSGEQLALEGMATATDAVPTWVQLAREVVHQLAATGQEFTSEDVTARVGLPRGAIGQHRNNAVGAVMSTEARAGTIRHVRYQRSTRPVSHAAVLSVWVGACAPSDATRVGE